jgi:hypothetical protein
MSSGLRHTGFISSITYDNLTPYYTTTTANEVIEFKNKDGKLLHLNSLLIQAELTDLYIRILPGDYCLFVEAGSAMSYDFEEISSIQVMGAAGQKLRWSGMIANY